MSIFNIKQSFILYQTFGNIYTIAPICKHAVREFHAIARLILLAHAQTNVPPVTGDYMLKRPDDKIFQTSKNLTR
jgi:hypothetical protein